MEKPLDLGARAEKHAAEDEAETGVGVAETVGQRQGRAPRAAEQQPAVDAEADAVYYVVVGSGDDFSTGSYLLNVAFRPVVGQMSVLRSGTVADAAPAPATMTNFSSAGASRHALVRHGRVESEAIVVISVPVYLRSLTFSASSWTTFVRDELSAAKNAAS